MLRPVKIKRYIIREVALSTAGVLAVLWAFLFCQEVVISFSRASRGDLAFSFLAPMILMHVPTLFGMVLPLATVLGLVFALGRLYSDGEMTACFIAGLRIPDLYTVLSPWISLMTLCSLVLHLWILPPLAHEHDKLWEQAHSKDSLEMIQSGKFYVRQNTVFYIERRNNTNNAIGELFVAKGSPGDPDFSMLRAEKGSLTHFRGQRYLIAENGSHYQNAKTALDYRITQFQKSALELHDPAPFNMTRTHGKSNNQLISGGTTDDWAELLMRLSGAIMLSQLAFLGIAIAPVQPKGSRMKPLLLAIILFLGYDQGLLLIRAASESEKIPLMCFALWHLLFCVVLWGIRKRT